MKLVTHGDDHIKQMRLTRTHLARPIPQLSVLPRSRTRSVGPTSGPVPTVTPTSSSRRPARVPTYTGIGDEPRQGTHRGRRGRSTPIQRFEEFGVGFLQTGGVEPFRRAELGVDIATKGGASNPLRNRESVCRSGKTNDRRSITFPESGRLTRSSPSPHPHRHLPYFSSSSDKQPPPSST